MLEELALSDAELSVVLSDDVFIRDLNRRYRRIARPTDVLAFVMPTRRSKTPPRERLLGDVIISLDTAARQADKGGRPLVSEVTHLLAHGLLHLLGYDHRDVAERREMDAMTRRLVAAAEGRRRAAKSSR
jgi:probable rRNA maturation factor